MRLSEGLPRLAFGLFDDSRTPAPGEPIQPPKSIPPAQSRLATRPGLFPDQPTASPSHIPNLTTTSRVPALPANFDTLCVSANPSQMDDSTFASDIASAAISSAFPNPGKPRRPRAGDAHNPSHLRPFVPAAMRALAWQTPFGTSFLGANKHLPASHLARVRAAIHNSLAKSSKSTYAAGLLRFTQYCDRFNIDEEFRMPAAPLLLCCFLAESIGSHGLKSAKNWLNGLAHWHHINLAKWSGGDSCVKRVLRAVDKDGKFVRPPRGPVTIEHLKCIRDNCLISSPKGAAYWALACAAFWGCRRLGELTLVSNNSFDASHDVSRSSRVTRSSAAGRSVITIHLPWTKTTGASGGSLILTSTDDDLCPVRALENHWAINHSPNADTPLFAFRSPDGWVPPVRPSFLSFLGAIFKAANLEQVFGHSFRIGGSVFLLCSGVEPEIVMKIGGWSSTCFLIYWRKLETVIPVALARAWQKHKFAFFRRNELVDVLDAELSFTSTHAT